MIKACLLDADILSLFFRNHPQVINYFNLYLQEYEKLNLSLITYYEILSGLKHRDANKQIENFLQFSDKNNIILLSRESVVNNSPLKRGSPGGRTDD